MFVPIVGSGSIVIPVVGMFVVGVLDGLSLLLPQAARQSVRTNTRVKILILFIKTLLIVEYNGIITSYFTV